MKGLGLILTAAAASASNAYGSEGVGPYRVPSPHGLHASPHAHIVFPLPRGWKQSHGALANTPELGSYHRIEHIGRDSCDLTVTVEGHAAKTPPRIVHGRIYLGSHRLRSLNFRIERRGSAGPLSWFLGRSKEMLVAASFEPAPAGAPRTRDSWSVFSMRLGVQAAPADGGSPSLRLRHGCVRERNHLDFLPDTIKRIRIASGPA
jgi:hypothetical protein